MTIPSLDAVLPLVRADRAAGLLPAWGWSTAVDENVGSAVVDRDVFDALHEAAGIDASFPVGHAGLVHVYGYLFSAVETPYGLKSDRWNDGVLARLLGLAPSWFRLGDSPDETPLARVTAAALPLLLDPPAGATAVIDQVIDHARVPAGSSDGPDGLRGSDAADQPPRHARTPADNTRGSAETTAAPTAPARTRAVVTAATPDGSAALVSGVDAGPGLQLITVFPVADGRAFAAGVREGDPRLRWNAQLPPTA
ncbi:MAG TPA: amino acid deaminase [Microbacterium sp.]|nr:amino acid deaminase [Microbacterium sp.]